jgi:hypothetical protein
VSVSVGERWNMVGTYGSDSASSSSPRFRFPSRADMTLACVGHTQTVLGNLFLKPTSYDVGTYGG